MDMGNKIGVTQRKVFPLHIAGKHSMNARLHDFAPYTNCQSKIHHGIGASSYITNAFTSSIDADPMPFALPSSSLNNPDQLGPIAQATTHEVEGYSLGDGDQNRTFHYHSNAVQDAMPESGAWGVVVRVANSFRLQPTVGLSPVLPLLEERLGLARLTKNDNMKRVTLAWQDTCESEPDRKQWRKARKDSHRLKGLILSNLPPSSKPPPSALFMTRRAGYPECKRFADV
ncbi:hypothetical protein IW261DRAFT_1591475 [Armillaria novae-zelandiae]|uniref:Uncharacterized protein n=1 Tax=Armillaria novae-zelandiae TaxID=153914 RepID=A0AA39PFC0_9AGAR|nr:hypothetical protein IW261DRAFT_1591475 [Armillaria novae-zelandiae]